MMTALCIFIGDTVRMQWQNDYDGDLRIECGDKQGLFRVASQYEFASKDRQWQWVCRNVAKISLIGCGWTGWVNDFDEPFLFRCPANNILAGVQSHHASDREDREWKFRCCRADKHFTMNCFASDYINDWHHRINYDVDQPYVFTGVYSFHTNEKE